MSDELEPLKPALRALLDVERQRPDLPAADTDALVARIEATSRWVAAGGSVAGAAKLAAWKVGLAALAVGAVGGGATVKLLSPPAQAPAPIVVQVTVAPPPVEAPVAREEPPPAPAPQVVKRKAVAAAPRVEAPPSPDARGRDLELARERELLERARTALTRGHPAEALTALEAHQQQFPDGSLAEERDGLWVHTLVAQGRLEEARARAAAFHRRFPKSMSWPAIKAAVGD